MRTFLNNYAVLLVLLIVFVVLKVPHLFYPHYWDEAWSYAPAVNLMYHHGPTLLPGSIDVEASRGHPLFFYASAAMWLKIFGNTMVAKHCFALFVSLAQLSIVYIACLRLFNKRVAIVSTILLAAQVTFFVQSAMLLPEILVGLLAFAAIYFYSAGKYFWSFVFLSCLFLTKESGLVMGIVLGADVLLSFFNKSISWPERWKKTGCVGGAGAIIVAFFLYQHHTYGWFLYPGHTGLIDYSWGAIFGKVVDSMNDLFVVDKMYRVFWLLLLLSVGIAIWKKQWLWLVYLLPATVIWRLVTGHAGFGDGKLYVAILALSFIAAFIASSRLLSDQNKARKFLLLGGGFFLLYIAFTVFNFITHRYLIAVLVWVVVYIAIWLDGLISRSSLYLYIPIAILLGLNIFKAYQWNTGVGDCNLQAFNAMKVQQDLIHYLEDKQAYEKNIGLGSFQQRVSMVKPEAGMLKSGKIFKHADWNIDSTTDYALFDNIEPDDRFAQIKSDSSFHLIFRTEHGQAWGEIFSQKRQD
ncbi:ArnT family glycosyltransferase [Taibaiella soli]|uniref:Uncharacterized protein n=1 Tax=Taibaiella soli TaxID=1649169 RepID=A0A2W2BBL0_9BACT|nr:glycosyltransferase family 39 protein [Taibaiella soli]PZF73277.1 hypothetical protein DN068_08895 [Taibaiella soli]